MIPILRALAAITFTVPICAASTLHESAQSQTSAPPCGLAPGYEGPQGGPGGGPSLATTCAALQAYVEAYNHHNLAATMKLIAPAPSIADCDFAWDRDYRITGSKPLRQWLRDRFAENDQLNVTIVVGGGIGDAPTLRVFAFHGSRTNDALTTQGLPPQSVDGSKGTVDDTGQLVQYYVLGDPISCDQHHLPPGASQERIRTLARVFLDAYNAGDSHRLLQLMTKAATYTDDAHCHRTTLHGRAAIIPYLATRTRELDRLQLTGTITTSPTNPTRARASATRSSRWLTTHNVANTATVVVFRLGGPGVDHLSSITIHPAAGSCLT